MERSDEDLMLAYQQGSTEALESLFTRYKLRIFNFAYRILGNRAEAEDVTGDIFLMMISKKQIFKPQAKFSTWLYTVARNKCLSRIRKQRPLLAFVRKDRETGEEASWEIPSSDPQPDEQLHKKDVAQCVQRAIQKLPLSHREAIVLREYHRLPYSEISEVLQCSLENVKVLIFRAREALRAELAPILKEGQS